LDSIVARALLVADFIDSIGQMQTRYPESGWSGLTSKSDIARSIVCRRCWASARVVVSRRTWDLAGFGAQGRVRTTDTRIFSPLLYQLSYLGLSKGHLLPAPGFTCK
jgi:hypothetical protein